MAALDDAITFLDTLISRLRTSTPSSARKSVAEKTLTALSNKISAPSEAPSGEAFAEKNQAVSSDNLSVPYQSTSPSEVDRSDSVEDFDKAFLQVGQVVSVEDHPVADKLYVCKVEIAQDQSKQVVAGLKKFLPSSELLGKKVCLVLNLKPAKLAGQLSEAMILAGEAEIDGSLNVKILQPPPNASVGDRIYMEGSAPSAKPAKQLSSKIWEKLLPLLHVQGGMAKFNERCLVTLSGAVTALDLPDGSSIH
ncbi:hypothetical protein GOP47_0019801 [Adiantum capillus-veneris]|uniref:tRNA-binding domain-containing protein n=1 Tax=Adiantum capillus-veneris TaxID=13818 RepID=A0A9D4UBS5_ADICA|nr:hypothetical protein GOP47_0019801 [Adiantum capillus-veneris]